MATAAQTFGNADRQAEVNPALMYVIEGLDNDMEYMFRVTAGNDCRLRSRLRRSEGYTGGCETGPADRYKPAVEVMPGDGMATVSWNEVEGATKYMVEWRTAAQTFGNADRQATVNPHMEYEIEDLKNGTEYMFRVTAGNDAGYGPPSDEAKATPTVGPYISQPTHLKVEAGDMMVMVSWRAPKVGADLVAGYRVSTRSTPGGVWEQKDAGMALKFTYEGLTNGVEYDVSKSALTMASMIGGSLRRGPAARILRTRSCCPGRCRRFRSSEP